MPAWDFLVNGGLPGRRNCGRGIKPAFTERARRRRIAAILVRCGNGTAPFRKAWTEHEPTARRKSGGPCISNSPLTGASEQMIAMIKSAAPLYQMFGDAQVRLLQNVDDPGRFLQEIEYDAPEALELNRQQIASDPRVQAYLQGWRAMFPGAIEIEVYKVL